MITRVLVVASLLVSAGCSSAGISLPSNLSWNGETYLGSATELRVEPEDLFEAGTIDSTNEARVEGRTVFALRGVDPEEAVVMPLVSGGYQLFKAQPDKSSSPALCRYFVDLTGTGCLDG